MNLIQTLEQEEIARLGKKIPDFAPGDTVIVSVNVVEGTRKRAQAFEGVVIAKRNRGLNSGFTVRKISSGEGVERTFQTYSPLIAGIEVKRRGDVRRAKLYYLRDRSGKSARIKEKLAHRNKPAPPPYKRRAASTQTAAGLVLVAVFSFNPSNVQRRSFRRHAALEAAEFRSALRARDRHRHAPAGHPARVALGRRAARTLCRAAELGAGGLDGAQVRRPRARPRLGAGAGGDARAADGAADRTHHAPVHPLGAGGLSGRQARRDRYRRGAHRAARGAGGDRPGAGPHRGDRPDADLHHRHALHHHAGGGRW